MTPGGTLILISFFEAAGVAAEAELQASRFEGVWSGEELLRHALGIAGRTISLGPDEVVRARAIFEGLWRSHYMGCAPSDVPAILAKAGEKLRASQRERDRGPAVARLAIARAKG